MTHSASESPAAAPELVFPLEPGADVYAIHQALDEKFGARREATYLWCLQRGDSGDLCIVRLPDRFVAPALAAGERWLFSLHARIGQKDRATGVRRSYRRTDAARRLHWLERRGATHGFSVVAATVAAVREPVSRPKGAFWLDRSEFSGVVEVSDPEKVAAALKTGIGGGRAWGLGMLRLIRKQED